jgi:hypothetical protein
MAAFWSAVRHETWERLWVEVLAKPWSSLVLVPACGDYSVGLAAEPLAAVGRDYQGGGVRAANAEHLGLRECRAFLDALGVDRQAGQRTVVSLSSPLRSQTAVVIARAADAAILVVPLDTCPLSAARETIREVGKERFIGSLVLHPPKA